MRVLVLDSDPEAVVRAVRTLADAGHTVERCCAAGAADGAKTPCHPLLSDPRCPLTGGSVDVAVAARNHPWPGPPLERGIPCLLWAGVPLVVADCTPAFDELVERCEQACARTDADSEPEALR